MKRCSDLLSRTSLVINKEYSCNVPEDVLSSIFKRMIPEILTDQPSSGLLDVACTSKLFRKCALNVRHQWIEENSISIKIHGSKSADEILILIKINNLVKVNLIEVMDFQDSHLIKLAKSCPQLMEIMLYHTRVTDEGIKALAEHCIHLTKLGYVIGAKAKKYVKAWPKLMEVDFSRSYITDEDVEDVAKSCPKLIKIFLSGTKVTDEGVKKLAEFLPNLEEIDLGETGVTDEGLKILAKRCLNLKSIVLAKADVSDDGVQAIAKGCPKLITINLESCNKVTNKGLEALTEGCPYIGNIILSHTPITSSGLTKFAKICRHLKVIKISGTQICDLPVIEIAKSCSNIREIWMDRCPSVTDKSVMEIAKASLKLREIDCSSTQVTSKAVLELAKNCPHLTCIGYLQEYTPTEEVINEMEENYRHIYFDY